MRRFLSAILPLVLTTVACGGQPASNTATPEEAAQVPSRGFYMGVAGLIPANFPDSSQDDWLNLYAGLEETGELLGIYTAWADSEAGEGEVPAVIDTVYGLTRTYAFTPFIALGTFRDAPAGGIQSTISWTDEEQVARFRQTAVRIAEAYHPPYLSLGVEINRFYDHDPQGFAAFVEAYAETYDAVKAVSPDTLVFTIFQLETLRGAGYLTGTSAGRQPHWELIEMFGERLDVAAFTTYPYFDYTAPADIPSDYYSAIGAHTDLPIAFSEIGWPSAPLSTAPESEYGGSPEEQLAFVPRFFELSEGLALAFTIWSFPHDIGPGINPAFESVALRHHDGTPKQALDFWRWVVEQGPPR